MKNKLINILKAMKMEIREHRSSFLVYVILRSLVILAMIDPVSFLFSSYLISSKHFLCIFLYSPLSYVLSIKSLFTNLSLGILPLSEHSGSFPFHNLRNGKFHV